MNSEQLQKGNKLGKIIETTKISLEGLKQIKCNDKSDKYLEDGYYNLYISKNTDGSGGEARLNRYYGNKALLEVIIKELERQLSEFEKMFKEL